MHGQREQSTNYAFMKFPKRRFDRPIRRAVTAESGRIDIWSATRYYIISVNIPDRRMLRATVRARAHVSVGCNYSTPLLVASAWIIRRISSRLVNSRNGTKTIDNHDVKVEAGADGATRTTSGARSHRAALRSLCTCCTIYLTISLPRELGLIIMAPS